MLYNHSCTLAAGNIMLAAHEMGSGTCWIGFEEYMRNTKEVPSPKRKNRLFLRNLYKDKEDILFMTKTS